MNIFRTLEAYKRMPKVKPENHPLRVARGVWVSGEHRDPITIDTVVHLHAVSSRPVEVRRYTEISVSTGHDVQLTFTGAYSTSMSVTDYYTTSTTFKDDDGITFTGVYSDKIPVTYYTTASTTFKDEEGLTFTGAYSSQMSVNLARRPKYTNTTPQATLRIIEVTSTPVEYVHGQ